MSILYGMRGQMQGKECKRGGVSACIGITGDAGSGGSASAGGSSASCAGAGKGRTTRSGESLRRSLFRLGAVHETRGRPRRSSGPPPGCDVECRGFSGDQEKQPAEVFRQRGG